MSLAIWYISLEAVAFFRATSANRQTSMFSFQRELKARSSSKSRCTPVLRMRLRDLATDTAYLPRPLNYPSRANLSIHYPLRRHQLSVYDLSLVSRVGVLSGHTGPVTTVSCGDDWVLSSSGASLRLWQVRIEVGGDAVCMSMWRVMSYLTLVIEKYGM